MTMMKHSVVMMFACELALFNYCVIAALVQYLPAVQCSEASANLDDSKSEQSQGRHRNKLESR